jgi:putative flippase GtrA
VRRQIITFGFVGTIAAGVHFSVVSLIVPLHIPPLVANVFGFLSAFGVSFLGHNYWSFPARGRAKHKALIKFFAVASSSFALNETLYWVLLGAGIPYRPALIIVLLLVAVFTLLLSRYWAFADAVS